MGTPAWLRSKLDPADLVQQTLLEFLRGADRLEGRPKHEALAYLRRALNNNLIDATRKFGGARAEVSPQAFAESSSGLADWLAAPYTSPSERAVRCEELLRLAHAMNRLPEDQRRVVELHHLKGLPVADVAQRMGRTRPAVVGLLFRGLNKLRELLREQGEAEA